MRRLTAGVPLLPHTEHLLTPPSPRRPPFVWLVWTVGGALVAAFLYGGAVIVKYRAVRKVTGFTLQYQERSFRVASVAPGGPASGLLLPGDRILAVDGDPRAGQVGTSFRLRTLDPGTPYELLVERGGQRLVLKLRIDRATRPAGDAPYSLSLLVVALAFVLTGILIGTARADESITRIGTVALFLSALTIFRSALYGVSPLLHGFETVLSPWIPSTSPFHLAVTFAFFAGFPASVRLGPFARGLRLFFFVVGTVVMLALEIRLRCLYQEGIPFLAFFTGLFPAVTAIAGTFDQPYSILAFGAICFAIARNYRQVREPDEIRRMRWITFGSLFGISPWLVYLVASALAPKANLDWMNRLANFALLIVPVTTGYAIVKHRLFDIRVVVRSGLRYLLARQVLAALLAVPVVGLTVTVYLNRNRTLEEILFGNTVYFYLFAVSALSLVYRKRLREWLDRMFFREAYNSERLLLELAREVPKLESLSEISRVVSRELAAALHPKSIHVFHRDRDKGSAPVLAFSFSSHDSRPSVDIPEDSELLRLMEGEDRPVDYPLGPHPVLPEAERRWLEDLGVSLIIPLNGGDGRLLGLVLLGEKLSEEPYGASDRKLLQAVASQMAIVHERSSLQERMDKDRRYAREVLSRLEDPTAFVKECPQCKGCQDGTLTRCPNDDSELVMSLPVARTLEGRYRLMKLIGRGGMGAVYEAQDQRLNRQVAVKILMGSLFDNHIAVRRFEREAQTSARLNHPNIIAVYDYGTLQTGGAFLVMELMRGHTLRSEIRTKGRLTPPACVPLFEQILEGVKGAHAAGVVHRDLKPENVLIGHRASPGVKPVVKILDFGLAKTALLDFSKPDSLTLPGTVLGSLGYMAPEQFHGVAIDPRTDVFAIGVLVAEAITGRTPFQGSNFREVMNVTLNHAYRLPGNAPGLRRLDAILQKCLAKDAEDRYASVEVLRLELLPALEDCPAPPYAATDGSDEVPTHEMS